MIFLTLSFIWGAAAQAPPFVEGCWQSTSYSPDIGNYITYYNFDFPLTTATIGTATYWWPESVSSVSYTAQMLSFDSTSMFLGTVTSKVLFMSVSAAQLSGTWGAPPISLTRPIAAVAVPLWCIRYTTRAPTPLPTPLPTPRPTPRQTAPPPTPNPTPNPTPVQTRTPTPPPPTTPSPTPTPKSATTSVPTPNSSSATTPSPTLRLPTDSASSNHTTAVGDNVGDGGAKVQPDPSASKKSSSSESTNDMMIAGIVIASLACLFATIAVVLLCLARHKRQKQESATIDTIPMSQLSQSPNRPQYDAAPRSPTPMVGQYSSRVSDITASTLDSYGAVQTKHYSTMQMVDSNAYANGNVNVDI